MMVLILQARLELSEAPRGAVQKLSKAAEIHHNMPYMEPEVWYMPVKQCLAATLLRLGDEAGAEKLFAEDLREHPGNYFSSVKKCPELGL